MALPLSCALQLTLKPWEGRGLDFTSQSWCQSSLIGSSASVVGAAGLASSTWGESGLEGYLQ